MKQLAMDQKLVQQFIAKKEQVDRDVKLLSFELFQEIMSDYVPKIIKLSEPIAYQLISEAEEISGEESSKMDKDNLVGLIAITIWTNIIHSLQEQIIRQTSSEENIH